MANSCQLVAWTDKGRVKMIPSQIDEFVRESLDEIDCLIDRVRYNTRYEVGDILNVSRDYEKLARRLLELGEVEDAFFQFAQAAECCFMGDNWEDYEDYEDLCRPLRGRFFAMLGVCRELSGEYPKLKYLWYRTGLRRCLEAVTEKDRWLDREYRLLCGDPDEAWGYTKALDFGRDEVYRRRKR